MNSRPQNELNTCLKIVAVKYAASHELLTLSDTKSAWDGKIPAASTPVTAGEFKKELDRRKTGLTLLMSIPIAGCDLLSSCLYTAGSCAAVSGKVVTLKLCFVGF